MSTENKNLWAVILAGGSGTRFWPKSRQKHPKQLCRITHPELSMLELTLRRLDSFIPPERRIIVTHALQAEATSQITQDLCLGIIAEPEAKNTAAALALANREIYRRDPDALMVSLHADADIGNVEDFKSTISRALRGAEQDRITLIGMTPEYPETGFGYLEVEKPVENELAEVSSFKEKPDLDTAQDYVASGRHFWNSGIFVWKSTTLNKEFDTYLPETRQILDKYLQKTTSLLGDSPRSELTEAYALLPSVAIDNAILEKSKKISMVRGDFGWQDVGSWSALERVLPVQDSGNLTVGDCLPIQCESTTLHSDGPLVTALGLKDMVVVASGGAVLVCPKDQAQNVKKIVAALKESGRSEWI